MSSRPDRPGAPDADSLYREVSGELRRAVSGRIVGAWTDLLDEACSYAWAQYARRQRSDEPVRGETARGWLITTAKHRALELIEQRQRSPTVSLDASGPSDQPPLVERIADPRGLEEHVEQRQRIAEAMRSLRSLPPRQARVVLARALGLSRAQMARATGDSEKTVDRLLRRADERLADLELTVPAPPGRRPATRPLTDSPSPPVHPLRRRLDELLARPPAYLVRELGRPPDALHPQQQLIWSRGALAIERYRHQQEITDPDRALGARPPALRSPARTAWQETRRTLSRVQQQLGLDRHLDR